MHHQARPPVPAPSPPPLPTQPPALEPGMLVGGRYLIQGYIGGGGFGHIYMAQDTVLGHRRALKEAFFRDQLTWRQFRLEAEFVLNARHPNLVRGYAVFEQAGRFYLVMDYVDGQTVEELTIAHIRRTGRPLPEAQILDWIIPICEAVAELHNQPTPIIHRDVKPANIKLTRQGAPVLIDLGLAKLYFRGTQTIGAALAFTPGYAPPEQYRASGATDQRTDVYGLGATLFYLLTGYQPTEAPARLSTTSLPAPRRLNPVLSPRVEAAVLKALALDPAERQQTVRELMRELQAARAELPGVSAPPGAAPVWMAPIEEWAARPCARCGTANAVVARYCMRCGADLSPDQAPEGATSPQWGEEEKVSGAGKGAQSQAKFEREQAGPEREKRQVQPPDSQQGREGTSAPVVVPAQQYAGMIGAISRALLGRAVDPGEARALIATLLALGAFSLSLLAVFAGWLIVLAVPGIALAWWSLSQWLQAGKPAPSELRWLAVFTLVLNCGWPLVWLVAMVVATQALRQ